MLGGSLHDVLARLKAQASVFPTIDVTYSFKHVYSAPVMLLLPENGLRLCFDGPDQRLRLIEVLDFSRVSLTYKGTELVKQNDIFGASMSAVIASAPNGPAFRQVYHRLFGPTFPGEYFPPKESAEERGTYILSYPGVAFSFMLLHSAWSDNSDFVSVLSSTAATPAKCLTVFNGSSWKDARSDLFTRPCPHPRSLSSTVHGRDSSPDEVELAIIKGRGRIELRRRSTPSFLLVLSETTPQDLVAQLGPPDAIWHKSDRRLSIHKDRRASHTDHPPMLSGSPGQVGGLSDTDRSSISAATDCSSPDEDESLDSSGSLSMECFYNYYRHGFDVFISHPSSPSPELDPSAEGKGEERPAIMSSGNLVATKILFHGNLPGSYSFNRYRRSRWVLDANGSRSGEQSLSSENPFSIIKKTLRQVWKESEAYGMTSSVSQKHMVLNRGWGDSPGSSCELLGSWEDGSESPKKGQAVNSILGNTELHGFPGLLFEVLKNDAVSCLTVY